MIGGGDHMHAKKHRLLTRWFSRRIDLGVVLAGCLYVFIWALLPVAPVGDRQAYAAASLQVQPTQVPLSALSAYLRPDLMLVASRYTFSPGSGMPDMLSRVPRYDYATVSRIRISEPEGMGALADLTAGMGRNHARVQLLPSVPVVGLDARGATAEARLGVRTSEGLGEARLRVGAPVWASELVGAQAWQFAFWVAFDREGGEATVFVQERSGDLERDLRLLRIVQRLDVWASPSGMGTVWLSYQPALEEEYARKDD